MLLHLDIVAAEARHNISVLLRPSQDASNGCAIGECNVYWLECTIGKQDPDPYGYLSGTSNDFSCLYNYQGLMLLAGFANCGWQSPDDGFPKMDTARRRSKGESETGGRGRKQRSDEFGTCSAITRTSERSSGLMKFSCNGRRVEQCQGC